MAAKLTWRMSGYEQLLSEELIIEYWVGRVLERMEGPVGCHRRRGGKFLP